MSKSFVFDDSLLDIYLKFKRAVNVNQSVVEKILHFYKPTYLTNVAQLNRIQFDDTALIAQLAQSQLIDQSLESLSCMTSYKIILTEDAGAAKAHFPYLNINNPLMANNYCISSKVGEPRGHIHKYLKGLFNSARNIQIHDQYFETNIARTRQIFELLDAGITVNVFVSPSLRQATISSLKTEFGNLRFPTNRSSLYERHHDRYILIDGKVEIIISSGIDYIFDNSKECLIVVRLLN